jgi:hypothetical protein
MKKTVYYDDAMRLYVREQLSFESIAELLLLNEKTLRRWAKSGNWQQKRDEFLTQDTALSDLHYQVSTLLLKRVLTHLKDSKQSGVAGFDERTEKMIQAAARLSPQTERTRKFEDAVNPQPKNEPTKSAISETDRLMALKALGVHSDDNLQLDKQ